MAIVRKTAAGKVDGSLSYVLSDATVDRYGDVIEPAGWMLDQFRGNPIALFNHSPNQPIGKWKNIRVEDDRLVADFVPAAKGTSRRTDEILSLIEQNILRATSVGFLGIESEPIDAKRPGAGRRYTRQELLETSIVSVPANPAALQLARSLGISDDTMRVAFGEHAAIGRRDMTTTGEHAAMKPKSRATSMQQLTTSQQIEDRQSRLNAARDKLFELSQDPEHDTDIADGLNAEIAEQERRLASLQATERSLALRTAQQPANAMVAAPAVNRRPLGVPSKERTPGDLFANRCVAEFVSVANRVPIERVLSERFPDDEQTALVTRAAIAGATTTTAGWALELVQVGQAEFVNSLMPNQVFPKLAAMGVSLSFGPNQGAIKIPSRATTPSIGGSFVAEGSPIPVRRLGTTSITLYPHKVGGISVMSREIAAYSNPDIEALIRSAIVDDTQINIDALLLDAVAVSTTRPAGLTNGVSTLTATAGGGYAAFLGDLNKLTAPFYAANAGRNLAMMINPAQRNQLMFAPGPAGAPFGWSTQFTDMFTVIASTSVAAGAVYMVDAADFVSVSGAPEFEVSETATIHMEDTTPLQIATGAQGSGVLATPTQSMFQTAQIAIRMLANVNWAMRRTGMVQFIGSGVSWA
jgi:HK97 family phage prohead protease/HK97 family phage major capsid protein